MREAAVSKVETLQRPKTRDVSLDDVERGVQSATRALTEMTQADGHICFELEADATIPSEYILFHQFRGTEPRPGLEAKIGNYLRRTQSKVHGGWALVHDGPFDMSASVKAYFALKMIGDDIEAPHMRAVRKAILQRGGAANANVFTRILLALYGEVPWAAVPVMPVEVMHLPKWFPFHLDKVSYWARCTMVPLFVIQAKKPRAKNPRGVGVAELFVTPPDSVRTWPGSPHATWPWTPIFGGIDRVLQKTQDHFPKVPRQRAIDKAVAWVSERLNGEDGLGAIFPSMVNSVLMYEVLGYPPDHPQVKIALEAIEKLVARMCSIVMMSLLPVAVTKMSARGAASSMVTTS